jgi:hypothetical protein
MTAYTRAKKLGVHEAVLSAHVAASELYAPLPYAALFVQLLLLCSMLYVLGMSIVSGTVVAAATPCVVHLIFLAGARWGRMNQWREEFEVAKIEEAERPAWLRRLLGFRLPRRSKSDSRPVQLDELEQLPAQHLPVRAPDIEREMLK